MQVQKSFSVDWLFHWHFSHHLFQAGSKISNWNGNYSKNGNSSLGLNYVRICAFLLTIRAIAFCAPHTDAVLAHRLNPLARYDDYVFTISIISAERIAHHWVRGTLNIGSNTSAWGIRFSRLEYRQGNLWYVRQS